MSDAAPQTPYDAILIIGFGGPESPAEIRPFLDRVLKGRPVARERYEEVVRHYEALGGRSPYNELTRRLAAGLREELQRRAIALPVAIGLRNTAPSFEEAMGNLARKGARKVMAFILSAFRCEASWERYQQEVAEACASLGDAAPEIIYPAEWHRDARFIAATADQVRNAIAQIPEADRSVAELIFTAHSIPIAMGGCETYIAQLRESAALVAGAVGRENWTIAFQSRSGNPGRQVSRQPPPIPPPGQGEEGEGERSSLWDSGRDLPRDSWLEPDIREAIVANRKPKIVMPIGFLCDHVEVLYDLDVEATAVAQREGIKMVRAATVGDHPRFIELVAAIAIGNRATA